MDLEKDYNKLYQHWLKEFEQVELTSFSQEDFNNYKKILANIKAFEIDKADNIKLQLYESYKKNIDFLFNDLLKIREIKIINAALANQEINLKNVIEAEKLLFQNLISTLKGYKKVKSLFLSEEEYSRSEEAIIIESKDTESLDLGPKTVPIEETSTIGEEEIDYNYILVRFLKEAPPLVGTDLLNYGPFQENDIANLPYENAFILISEKFAEKITID